MSLAPRRLPLLLLLLLLLLPAGACRTAETAAPTAPAPTARDPALLDMLDALYRSFCFDAGAEPDWSAMERMFAPGAAFVAPIAAGRAPKAIGAEEFLRDFKAYVLSPSMRSSGLHERILHVRADTCGAIAHAWVTFEGFLPGSGARHSQGVDSLQLVRDGGAWKLVGFTTHYATKDAPLPASFLAHEPR